MGIINRRNAVVGWFVVKAGKELMRRKAKEAVPGTVGDTKRPNKSAIASGVAALGGALLVLRHRRSSGGDDEE